MKKTWCVGGRHMRIIYDTNDNEKRNPKNKNLVKINRGKGSIFDRKKSQIFTK